MLISLRMFMLYPYSSIGLYICLFTYLRIMCIANIFLYTYWLAQQKACIETHSPSRLERGGGLFMPIMIPFVYCEEKNIQRFIRTLN